ncbi:hypothetical protein IW261DRAFT_1566325 [Armillaria novae-zelandiae]|uniref:Uncharacterized protein n=1 Tax=Armillaria novae-zelandiae TaxID=153914 RepID=A0AA39P4G3_9AGAR|nr:hypothetical protein IW261DRAFT_1566325 [Armillaria novae-zelandiae]
MDPFPSNLLDLAMMPFNSLAADLNFFLVGLQQGPPKNSHLSPHLSPLPPMYDDSNLQQGLPKDLQLPPLLPLPPMYDNSNMQEDFPPLPLLPPVHDNSNMQQGSLPLPPLPPVHDDGNMMLYEGQSGHQSMLKRAIIMRQIQRVAEPAGLLAGSRGAFTGTKMLSWKGPYGHAIIKTFSIIALAPKLSLQHLPTPSSKLFE